MKAIRPTPVSILSWLLIISAVFQLFLIDQARQSSSSPFLTPPFGVAYASAVMTAVFGVLLLNGLNWARFLYVLFGVAQIWYVLATGLFRAYYWPPFIGFGLMALVLFLPQSNAYFRGYIDPKALRGLYWRGH